jgi:AcrR family transcriptional regulator
VNLKVSELKTEVIALKRKLILEASAHLIFELGYENTTLDAIADQLQVTKPYLYSYFRNKSHILFEISQTGIRESLAAMDGALTSPGSPMSRLKTSVERVAHIVIDKRQYVVVYEREEKNLSAEDAAFILSLRREFDRKLTALLNEGLEAGEFAVPDSQVVATTIGGIITWLPRWYVSTGRLSQSEVVGMTVQLIEKMLQTKQRPGEAK